MVKSTKAFLGTRVVMLCAGHATLWVDLQSDAHSINQSISVVQLKVPFTIRILVLIHVDF